MLFEPFCIAFSAGFGLGGFMVHCSEKGWDDEFGFLFNCRKFDGEKGEK